ncbi:MAG: hypothetical protein ACREJD_13635 [Phycisphaerales bacterium]
MTPIADASALRVFLESRDEPCPSCGYNLRGLASGACPECKHVPRLQLLKPDWPSRGRVRLALALGALGVVRGIAGAVQSGYDLWHGQIRIPSVSYALLMVMWFVMYLWLFVLCAFGFVNVLRTRNSDLSRRAVDRLVGRLLLYLLVSLLLAVSVQAARLLGLM